MASGVIRAQRFDKKSKPDWAPPAWPSTPAVHVTQNPDLAIGAVVHLSSWPKTITNGLAYCRVEWGEGGAFNNVAPSGDGLTSLPAAHTYPAAGTYEITVIFGPAVTGVPTGDALTSSVFKQKVVVA